MSGNGRRIAAGRGRWRRNKNGKNYAAGIDLSVKLCYTVRALGKQNIAEWSSSVARRAHNPKVVGSNPSSATISSGCNGFQLHPLCFLKVGASMDYGISPDTFVGESLETAFGLKAYSTIMQFTKNRPFVATPEFRKTFNGYYKLRQRSAKWYDKYYSLFESQFCADCSFEDLLREMHTVNGSLEVSFISKLIATVNPQIPIWDQYVVRNIGLESEWLCSSRLPKEKRIQKAVEIYNKIVKWYSDFLNDETGKACIKLFDQLLPQYKDKLSDTKKIDCILWSKR